MATLSEGERSSTMKDSFILDMEVFIHCLKDI